MRISVDEIVPRKEACYRSLRTLYTPEQSFVVLRRERARADRYSGEFSLVLFKVEGCLWPSPSTLRLAKIVQSRCRVTDEVGRFDSEYICAILPDTTAAGAWRFAQGVCEMAKSKALRPLCVVYTYPNAWFRPGEHERPGPRLARSINGQSEEHVPASDGSPHMQITPESRQASAPIERRDLVPHFLDGITTGLTDQQAVQQIEALLVRPMPWWKRLIDIVGASIGLIVHAPFMLIIAILIKLTSKGPVFFWQKRAGLGGKPFWIVKFRTMVTDAEAKKAALRPLSEQDGPAFKLKNDPRVTWIGKFLRTTSLDELPQLWNVLKGEMSLVGPRPLPVDESDGCDQWQRARLEVTPGLTCIWQISGRSTVSFDEWVRMDINYIRRRKLMHDLSLIVRTLPAVLLRRGAR